MLLSSFYFVVSKYKTDEKNKTCRIAHPLSLCMFFVFRNNKQHLTLFYIFASLNSPMCHHFDQDLAIGLKFENTFYYILVDSFSRPQKKAGYYASLNLICSSLKTTTAFLSVVDANWRFVLRPLFLSLTPFFLILLLLGVS